MASRYWVAFSSTNWNDSFNWASTSGGLGGASVPSSSDDVFFDGNGTGSCSLDVNVSVVSITISSGYTGTLDAVTFDLTTSGNFTDSAGRILFGSGTWNIGGNLTLRGTSNTNCQSATINVTGNTPFNQGANGWIPGTSVWTVGGNVDAYNGQPASSGTYPNWSFTQTGTGKTAQFRSFSNYTIASGASITNARSINGKNITIDGTHDLNGRTLNVTNLTVSSTGVIKSTASGGRLGFNVVTNSLVDIVVNIQGTLILNSWKMYWSLRNCKYIYRLQTTSGLELPNFEFGAGSTAGFDNWRLQIENDVVFAQSFLFYSDGSGTPGSLNNSTYNPNITFKGDVTFRIAGGMNYNVGTGTITFDGPSAKTADFNGETVEAIVVSDNSVGSITLADNVTTPYVHDCANQIDENGYTVTTTGTDPSPCSTGTRYWVGLVDTDYENTGNWSTSSGGLGNASVPVGSNDVVFDSGSSTNCTMTASRSVASINAQSGYGGAIDFAANSMRCVGNFTLDHGGGMDFGSGTHYMGGFFDVKDCGTLDYATSSVELAGTGTNMLTWSAADTNKAFYDVIVSGNLTTQNVPYSAVRATNSYTISGTLTHNASGGRQTSITAGALVVSGTLAGSGDCAVITSASGVGSLAISGSGSVTIGKLRASLGGVTGSYVEIGAGDYSSCDVEMSTSNNHSDAPLRFSGDVTLKSLNFTQSSGANNVLQNSTHNPSITLKGDLTCTTSNVTWSAGTGTIILDNVISQSINFNGQTVEGIHVTDASTGSIVLANNFSTAWLRDCNDLIDLNGYTITNADTEDRCAYPYDPPTTIALDSAAAINTDLVGWWHLLDGTGSSAADISTSANNLSHSYGEFSWNVTKLGTVGNFIDSGLLSTSTVPTLTDKLTISQWLYYEGSIGRETSFAGNTSGANYAWSFRTENSGDYMRFSVNGSFTESSQLAIGQWIHIVGVYDGTDIRLYIDGVQDGTPVSVTGNVSAFNNIFIGNQDADSDVFPFTGFAQNTRIWSRALTSTEVASLYSDPWIGSDYTAVVPLTNRYFAPAAFGRLG